MRIYVEKLKPESYPEYALREYPAPNWELFYNQTQFITLRCFNIKDNRLSSIGEDLDLYSKRFDLGQVIWPYFPTMYTENFYELAEELKRRGMFLFDIWGHVPGSDTLAGGGCHVTPPEGSITRLNEIMGDHFLGMDNGEQDGRYIFRYAPQQCPSNDDRFAQFMNFHRFFRRMGDDLGNKMNVLLSLCNAHYFAREGNHMLLGAEAAQALPCSQIYYSFIRGAGKQYGILWFGNVSVFNRWGYKSYCREYDEGWPRSGVDKGTSLSLMRRLLYSHIMYNSVAVGFEQGWFYGDDNELRTGQNVPFYPKNPELSPIGIIQETASKWVKRHGNPGTMLTPVGLLLDAFGGWNVPIHLYIDHLRQSYQTWGVIPYNEGDYLTHGIFSLIYPGYEAASYYRDERGFMTPTPFGDCMDVLLSDVRLPVMDQYNVIIASSRIDVSMELRDKLDGFMRRGGTLVITAGNAAGLWPELNADVVEMSDNSMIAYDGKTIIEPLSFKVMECRPVDGRAIAVSGTTPLVSRIPYGDGEMILLHAEWGVNSKALPAQLPEDFVDNPLPCPYVMLEHVRAVIGDILKRQQIVSVSNPELAYVTNRRSTGDYTVSIYNNGLTEQRFSLTAASCIRIESIDELPLDQRVKLSKGYWPTGIGMPLVAECGEGVISPGDVRIFRVKAKELNIFEQHPEPIDMATGHNLLALRNITSAMEKVLSMPTFEHYFRGVKLDWRYLHEHDSEFLRQDGEWFRRKNYEVWVDLSSGCNHYPDFHFMDTYRPNYEATMRKVRDVMKKAVLFGASNMVFSLHVKPECHCPQLLAEEKILDGVKALCRLAAEYGFTMHLQAHPTKMHGTSEKMRDFVSACACDNLTFAINPGHVKEGRIVLDSPVVLACAPDSDIMGNYYDYHLPFRRNPDLVEALRQYQGILIFDSCYSDWDDIYMDLKSIYN